MDAVDEPKAAAEETQNAEETRACKWVGGSTTRVKILIGRCRFILGFCLGTGEESHIVHRYGDIASSGKHHLIRKNRYGICIKLYVTCNKCLHMSHLNLLHAVKDRC